MIYYILVSSNYHFLDIFDDLEIAEPPDLTDIDPLEDIRSIELGALL